MNVIIPNEIRQVYEKIKIAGFEAYLVGGSVRGIIMQKQVKDWDLATNAVPEEILKIFPNGFYDNSFGTVGLPVEALAKSGIPAENKQIVEITSYQT